MSAKPVQSAGGSFGSSASAQTVSLPASATAGNFLAVVVNSFNAGITVTVSDGVNGSYTQAGTYGVSGSNRASVWFFPNTGGGAITVTVTPSATAFLSIGVAEFSGVVTSTPLDGTSQNNGSGNTASTGSIAVSGNGELIVAAFAFNVAGNRIVTYSGAGAFFVDNTGTSENGAGVWGIADSAINPTITITGAVSAFAVAGASFKVTGGGGTAGVLYYPGMSGGMEG